MTKTTQQKNEYMRASIQPREYPDYIRNLMQDAIDQINSHQKTYLDYEKALSRNIPYVKFEFMCPDLSANLQ